MDEEHPLHGRTILVVDDEADVRVFLTTVLADAGATVMTATDGAEAVAVAQEKHPDLITLDLSMPGKDGVEAFHELRNGEGIDAIPVCVVTGHPEFKRVIYERTVPPPEGFLHKPVEADDLVDEVRRILWLRDRKRARTEEPRDLLM